MTPEPTIRGGATADETAAIMAAIALLLEEQRTAVSGTSDQRSLPSWVRLGRFAQPSIERSGNLPSTFAQPHQL